MECPPTFDFHPEFTRRVAPLLDRFAINRPDPTDPDARPINIFGRDPALWHELRFDQCWRDHAACEAAEVRKDCEKDTRKLYDEELKYPASSQVASMQNVISKLHAITPMEKVTQEMQRLTKLYGSGNAAMLPGQYGINYVDPDTHERVPVQRTAEGGIILRRKRRPSRAFGDRMRVAFDRYFDSVPKEKSVQKYWEDQNLIPSRMPPQGGVEPRWRPLPGATVSAPTPVEAITTRRGGRVGLKRKATQKCDDGPSAPKRGRLNKAIPEFNFVVPGPAQTESLRSLRLRQQSAYFDRLRRRGRAPQLPPQGFFANPWSPPETYEQQSSVGALEAANDCVQGGGDPQEQMEECVGIYENDDDVQMISPPTAGPSRRSTSPGPSTSYRPPIITLDDDPMVEDTGSAGVPVITIDDDDEVQICSPYRFGSGATPPGPSSFSGQGGGNLALRYNLPTMHSIREMRRLGAPTTFFDPDWMNQNVAHEFPDTSFVSPPRPAPSRDSYYSSPVMRSSPLPIMHRLNAAAASGSIDNIDANESLMNAGVAHMLCDDNSPLNPDMRRRVASPPPPQRRYNLRARRQLPRP